MCLLVFRSKRSCFQAFSYVACLVIGLSSAKSEEVLAPFIDGEWTQIAGNPDLGKYTTSRQQPVDFAVWQAADGTWQALSCIRKTSCGGHTRLFHQWEGKNLTDPNWKPVGVTMESKPELGEVRGGLQAPHVVKVGDTYHMCYGDWNNICHATSKDGKTFKRVTQPNGKTAAFSGKVGINTRDVMLLKVKDRWFGYYTAYPNRQGTGFVRTTKDFNTWSEPTAIAFGGIAGTGPFTAECPHVIYRHGYYYLFRTQKYGMANITRIYRSKNPYKFGINQDEKYLIKALPVAAPEIVRHNGQDYIVALNEELNGLRIAKLGWKRHSKIGKAVFPLENKIHRKEWKNESGNLASALTNSKRTFFGSPKKYFVATGEIGKSKFNDELRGEVRSPVFTLNGSEYYAYISGGSDINKLYVAIIDAETDEELLRFTNNFGQSNVFKPHLIQTNKAKGKRVYLKIVDQATDSWGHINFGGLYTAE